MNVYKCYFYGESVLQKGSNTFITFV